MQSGRLDRMTLATIRAARELRAPLDELIETHGLLRVSLALLRAALRRGGRRPPPVHTLPDHLLRDIGIEPERRGRNYWNLR